MLCIWDKRHFSSLHSFTSSVLFSWYFCYCCLCFSRGSEYLLHTVHVSVSTDILRRTPQNEKASWADGSAWSYSDWMPGHPNIHTDKPVCVEMFKMGKNPPDTSWPTRIRHRHLIEDSCIWQAGKNKETFNHTYLNELPTSGVQITVLWHHGKLDKIKY